jgi:hypothetical protein
MEAATASPIVRNRVITAVTPEDEVHKIQNSQRTAKIPNPRKRLRHGWSSQPWLAADARNLSGREPHRGRPAVLLPPHPWPRSFGQRGLARGQIRALGRRGRCFGVAVATADGVPSLGTELGLTERRWRGAARGSRGGAMFSAVIARLW